MLARNIFSYDGRTTTTDMHIHIGEICAALDATAKSLLMSLSILTQWYLFSMQIYSIVQSLEDLFA